MCDPVSMFVGTALGATGVATTAALGGAVVYGGLGLAASKAMKSGGSDPAPATPTSTPAEEQAKAEASAAQKANAELATANRRRRGQQSLMATGAQATPSPATFGDSPGADGISPLGGIAPRMNRSTVAKRAASLMSGGAASPVMGGAPRGTPAKMQMLER